MTSSAEINHESVQIAHQAELGRPADLQHVHQELQNDMSKYSAKDYGTLLNGIQKQNDADIKANSHLPKLELSDSGGKGVNDSVSAHYADGSVMTSKGEIPKPTPASSGTAGTSGAGDAQQHPPVSGPQAPGRFPEGNPPPASSGVPDGGSKLPGAGQGDNGGGVANTGGAPGDHGGGAMNPGAAPGAPASSPTGPRA
jgi:hypothetical protein